MELIKFRQTVCRPCIELDNLLNYELEAQPDVTYIMDDADSEKEEIAMERASEFGIMNSPVLILVDDNGVEVDRVVGYNPSRADEVRALFEKAGKL